MVFFLLAVFGRIMYIMGMDKLLELFAWFAIDLKLGKDVDLPREKGEKHSNALELTAAVIVIAGFCILAFAV